MRTRPAFGVGEYFLAILLLAFARAPAFADVLLTEGTNISVHAARDGRLITDLLGGLWVIPRGGGAASALPGGDHPASRPRWSPDAATIAYQTSVASRNAIWIYRFATEQREPLSDEAHTDQHPDWHPDGTRLIFSSARHDSGFDLWEVDLETRLAWRLTSLAGNETEPSWSADGRSLIYVHENAGVWSLMLRRFGRNDEVIVRSTRPLAAPAWRPDGSLVTYLRRRYDGWSVSMTILSYPRLDRTLISDEDLFIAPVTWLDRQQMVYAANGQIRVRRFNSWTSSKIPFHARVGQTTPQNDAVSASRVLPDIEEPSATTIIRTGRLYDGLGDDYLNGRDIVIDGGHIASVSERSESLSAHPGAILIDLGETTALPGFIDAYATLPESADASLGPLLLGLGVTTLVVDNGRHDELNQLWSGKHVPGPRVLQAATMDDVSDESDLPWLVTVSGNVTAAAAQRDKVREWQALGVAVLADSWQVGLASGASLLLGTSSRPTSPAGRRYQDIQLASGNGAITFVSGLADALTPNVTDIWAARPAAMISERLDVTQRHSVTPRLSAAANTLVLGSKPNGLPPGIALHAEFRALAAAGLSDAQALRAAGVNAASALGLGIRLGRIAPGAAADLVLVDGDPLDNIDDALKIVGVVRNGRFFSVSGLMDRARAAATVD